MAPPATLSVFNILRNLAGNPISGAQVKCVLASGFATVTATGDSVAEVQLSTTTDSTGRYAFTIVGTDLLSPANQVYTIMEPHRSYDIAPLSTNGATQQTTAANVIVSTPTALAPATSNVTGPLTVSNGLIVSSGGATISGGLTVSSGAFSIPAGGFTMAGPLTLTAANSQIIPGATNLSLRNNANNADNLLISDAGAATVRAGLTVTAGGLTVSAGGAAVTGNSTVTGSLTVTGDPGLSLSATASRIVAGATSLALRNNANSADNVLVSDAGAVTIRAGLTITASGETITAGNLTLTAGNLVFSAASAKVLPGATSLLVRNNADSASNLALTDAGLATFRNALEVPYAAAQTLPAHSYGTIPVKIDDQLLGGSAASVTFAPNPLPTGFRHLLIEWYARGDTAATSAGVQLRFNNDTAANYDNQTLRGTAATASAAENLGATSIKIGSIPANTATANYFGQGSCKVFHYNGTTGNKLATGDSFIFTANTTGTGFTDRNDGKWRTAATAITRLDIFPSAGNFVAGSVFTLWGIP